MGAAEKRRIADRLPGRTSRPLEKKSCFEILAGLKQSRKAVLLPRNAQQTWWAPPESKWWRKDPRPIPKVFLIDAYEVS
jgi:hypothetical protein